MNKVAKLVLLTLTVLPCIVFAGQVPLQCSLVSGKIIELPHKPVFKFMGSSKNSRSKYTMSHTQFFIEDGNGTIYKVVVDNLFYNYITNPQASINRDIGISADFKRRFPVGSSVEACGKLFQRGKNPGIHFVHPSGCAKTNFDGFLRINGADITNNLEYCGNCGCRLNYN